MNRRTFPGLVSPDGVVYANIENLSEFCKEKGLPYQQMAKLARGNCKHVNKAHGWTHIDNPNPVKVLGMAKKYPNVLSPDGKMYEVFNASKFAREHGLSKGFYLLFYGRVESYKGWRVAD